MFILPQPEIKAVLNQHPLELLPEEESPGCPLKHLWQYLSIPFWAHSIVKAPPRSEGLTFECAGLLEGVGVKWAGEGQSSCCVTHAAPLLSHKSSGGWCLGTVPGGVGHLLWLTGVKRQHHTVGFRCLSLHSRAQKKVTMFPLALDLWCLGRTLRDQYLSNFLVWRHKASGELAKMQRSGPGTKPSGDAMSLLKELHYSE